MDKQTSSKDGKKKVWVGWTNEKNIPEAFYWGYDFNLHISKIAKEKCDGPCAECKKMKKIRITVEEIK